MSDVEDQKLKDKIFDDATGFWWAPRHIRDEWHKRWTDPAEERKKKLQAVRKSIMEQHSGTFKLLADM